MRANKKARRATGMPVGPGRDKVNKRNSPAWGLVGEWLVLDRPAGGLQVLTNVGARFVQCRGRGWPRPEIDQGLDMRECVFARKFLPRFSVCAGAIAPRQAKESESENAEEERLRLVSECVVRHQAAGQALPGPAGDRRCHKIRSRSGRASLHDEL